MALFCWYYYVMARKSRSPRRPTAISLLTLSQILAAIKAYHRRTGEYPNARSGVAIPQMGFTWSMINTRLRRQPYAAHPEANTLARLLGTCCGVPHPKELPRLTYKRILELADKHYERTGRYPIPGDNRVLDDPRENWGTIEQSIQLGRRGLPGGWTLRQLLHKYRRRKTRIKCPDVTVAKIARWAQRHKRETDEWPLRRSGPVRGGYPHDTWHKLDMALWRGARSLPGGSSLPRLLFEHFGVMRRSDVFQKKRRSSRRLPPRDGSSLDPFARRPRKDRDDT